MTHPIRIQLSRAKGWRMPPDTVKVDRSTRWGNPFKVGEDGTQEHCVNLFMARMCGHLVLTRKLDEQRRYPIAEIPDLAGKNLACWCRLGTPCHADVLLEIANKFNPDKASNERKDDE